MAIPRDKIYWLCAQVGRKGGPFYVRLLLFTEEQILFFEGNDVDRIKEIADGLYQYSYGSVRFLPFFMGRNDTTSPRPIQNTINPARAKNNTANLKSLCCS